MKIPKMVLSLMSAVIWIHSANAKTHEHHQGATNKPAVAAAADNLNDESIYNLNSELLDKDGKSVSLKMFRGQPVVISMAYTSCTYTCPLIVAQMQQIEKALVEAGKTDVHFVLVSFDPKKDTPKVLSDFAAKKKLSERWSLLTSHSDKEPREIANLLGIKYKKVEGGDYDHSFVISVLDKEGVIRGKQVGAGGNPKDLIKFLP
ncbi:SCO family protein [Bdellovibrio svalbardensis]|uniref:SCO family protein n=1 Tax=Bdellovibrio svalbardensis TaxID=2972972 RepID=A0ABT6DLE8_9BACT|nr:SCO family protein [Bdellovibrio svalbardensis]MDG0816905.1 SCO family protein [Bdellovibrio svalbardensis]